MQSQLHTILTRHIKGSSDLFVSMYQILTVAKHNGAAISLYWHLSQQWQSDFLLMLVGCFSIASNNLKPCSGYQY